MLKTTSDYVPTGTTVIESGSRSREGRIVPELVFKYGNGKNHIKKIPRIFPWLIGAITGRYKGYSTLKVNPLNPSVQWSEPLKEELETSASSLGCSAVGYAEVDDDLIFKGKNILYSHAIVLAMPMDKKYMSQAPDITAGKEVWRIYDRLGMASNRIAGLLREKGYGAQSGAALGGDVNYPLLAQRAGMGWIGRNGLLISPGTGCSQRLAAVFTSIENLPVVSENTHKWIARFCEKCGKCVKSCPGGAIYEEKPVIDDGGPKHIDHAKCAVPFSNTMGCSVCIRDCVFFKGDYEKIKRTVT